MTAGLYVLVNEFGFPTQTCVTVLPSEEFIPGPEVNDPSEVHANGYWIDSDGVWHQVGPAPSFNYTLNQVTKAWIPNYDVVQAQLSRELDRERIERNQYAIAVNGVMFDGDKVAQDNLKNKIEEVRSRIDLGIGMPAELLVWRDANNTTHAWGNINEYYAWLQSFAVALSDRGTRLYLAMWAHKAAIQALIDAQEPIDEIAAYDVTTGWAE